MQTLQPVETPETRRLPIHSVGAAGTAIILLLGALISVLGWLVVKHELELEMARQTALYASTVAGAIESHVRGVYDALRRRAELWSEPQRPPDFWQASVELFLRENPSLLAIAHSDLSRPMLGSDEGIRILKGLIPTIARTGEAAEGDFVIGPVMLGDGRPMLGLRVQTEIVQPSAAIYAVFDPGSALHALLDQRATGYGVRVSVADQEIYRHEPSDAEMLLELAHSDSVALGVGPSWSLQAWPTSTVAVSLYEQGPMLVLAAGLAASALIALAVHYGTLAWRRADALRASNAELERQIAETRRGEGDLKQLSEELEARVAQRTAELHETIVELETFNYSVSHDLRGPLGAVINFAAILREDHADRLDASATEMLSRIVHSASAAVSMMDALLAYSRSGRTELHKTFIDVGRLVQEVRDDIVAASPQLSCALKIGDLPNVVADEAMTRFIFTNLISNACKFVSPGEAPRVEVGGSIAGNEATFYVRDEGVGFDMRFADKLFKVFERLHGADLYEGHGVGLAIVARMVRRHDGRVWAQGAVGKGATFYFSMPVQEGEGNGLSKS